MIQKAVVKRILDQGLAEIEVQRQSACGHDCASCGGCGAPQERIQAVARNIVDAKVGDTVTVEGENKQIMRMAAIVYTLPLVLFFAFFVVASLCSLGEGVAGALGQSAAGNRTLGRGGRLWPVRRCGWTGLCFSWKSCRIG